MAKKSSRRFQFQFGWGGMIAIIISSFCALLWMFILGLWVGQKIVGKPAKTGILAPKIATMSPPPLPGENTTNTTTTGKLNYTSNSTNQNLSSNETNTKVKESPLAPKSFYSLKQTGNQTSTPGLSSSKNKNLSNTTSTNATSTTITTKKSIPKRYFVLQIASYREKDNAVSEARRWRRKGYDSKVVKVFLGPKKGVWYRVYLGQFNTMQEAMAFARRLAKKEGLKSYIVEINSD